MTPNITLFSFCFMDLLETNGICRYEKVFHFKYDGIGLNNNYRRGRMIVRKPNVSKVISENAYISLIFLINKDKKKQRKKKNIEKIDLRFVVGMINVQCVPNPCSLNEKPLTFSLGSRKVGMKNFQD